MNARTDTLKKRLPIRVSNSVILHGREKDFRAHISRTIVERR